MVILGLWHRHMTVTRRNNRLFSTLHLSLVPGRGTKLGSSFTPHPKDALSVHPVRHRVYRLVLC